jgi:hypothetical protein
MQWGMDGLIRSELTRQSLPVRLASTKDDADFVMTGSFVTMGSRFSTSREFVVNILAANGGRLMWSATGSDTAAVFGSLRNRGAARAARVIVRKLRRSLAPVEASASPPAAEPQR